MLLDTSGLLCLFDADDYRYQDAQIFYAAAKRLRGARWHRHSCLCIYRITDKNVCVTMGAGD